MQKTRTLTGALAGLMLTAPLVTLFFLGDVLAGLPLLTFDVFDWMARTLPGPLITIGIDLMVDTLIALGFNVASVAKTAEHILAVIGQLATGGVAGAVVFSVLELVDRSQLRDRLSVSTSCLALGALLSAPFAAISLSVNQTAASGALVSTLWIVALYTAWGAAIGWIYSRLTGHEPKGVAVRFDDQDGTPVAVEQISRREFLVRVGTATAAFTVVGAGLSAMVNSSRRATAGAEIADSLPDPTRVPLTNPDAALEPAPGTRPEITPLDDHYRIDISSRPPVLAEATWTLPITGLVETPLSLTLDDLRNNYEPIDRYITLSCISNRVGGNLIGTTKWTGASLKAILDDAGLMAGATGLDITSADGFHETVALDLINSEERIMLAYAWDDQPLKEKHGFPLRIWIPDRFGMKQPKWIVGMEVIDFERDGYWVARGWDRDAIVRTTSVIDTVAVDGLIDGDPPLVPIGGIAYSGARGISRVEVRVDRGPWTEADLREPVSDTTWSIWRYDWPFSEGRHTFEVRCYDASGALQFEGASSPRPSGATGIHSITASL